MSRIRKTIFEDLFEAASIMSWWMTLLFALISYLALHQIAALNFNAFIIAKPLVSIAQYVTPLIFILGAAIAATLHSQVLGTIQIVSEILNPIYES